MLTAAHCTCSLKNKDPNDQPHPHVKALCKPYDKNQITPGFNQIIIYGGHTDYKESQSDRNVKNTFRIPYVYIMDGAIDSSTDKWKGKHDIGMLITEIPLFDKKKLKELKESTSLDRPPILPICLAAKASNLNNEKIMGVGWGLTYEESPSSDFTKEPFYSTCMTNEVGPDKWVFEHCDIQFLKNNNWACEKKKYPNLIKKNRDLCKKLFDEARKIYDNSKIEFMDKVDKIHLYKQEDPDAPIQNKKNPFLTCYNEKHFLDEGWCKVHGDSTHSNSEAWGFCSPSCKENLMKVLI